MNVLRQHAASKTFDVQVFYENQSELVHQHASQFVLMVVALAEDVLVNLTQQHHRLTAAV